MQQNQRLNDVLIVICRSLLQFAAEAWPWTRETSNGALTDVDGLIAAQKTRIEKLSDLLDGRRWTIDFGAYPDFTDLYYLSLEFVLPHLVANQQAVVKEIEAALPQCAGDAEGAALLEEILHGERAALSKLEELTRPQPHAPAQSAA
jgi:hypothetical protein